MATTRIKCSTCGSFLEVTPEMLDKEVECGECSEVFVAKASAIKRSEKAAIEKESPGDEKKVRDEDWPAKHKRRRRFREYDDEYGDERDRTDVEQRSRLVYILLALFFGTLGVHNFYAGRTGPAIAQLLITIVSIPLMCAFVGLITIFIPWVWAIVDIVVIDRDGNGLPMKS